MTHKLQFVDNLVKTNFVHCIAFCFLSIFENFCCLKFTIIKKSYETRLKTATQLSQRSSPKHKRDFKVFHIGSKCSRDCSTLANLFSLGAVEVSPHLFSAVCSLHQRLTGGEVTGVEVSANEVKGGGIGDSIPQADSSLSISWRDPN